MNASHLKKGVYPQCLNCITPLLALILIALSFSGCRSEVEPEITPVAQQVTGPVDELLTQQTKSLIPTQQTNNDYHRVPMGEPAPSFDLINQDNQPITMESLKGKAVLLTFIYTYCPDICPATLNKFQSIAGQLTAKEREQLAIVSITLDPERDTADHLREYGRFFSGGDKGWFFLTGERSRLEQIWQAYEIQYTTAPNGNIIHPSMVVLIDKQGIEQIDYHGMATPTDIIVTDLKKILAEK